MKLEKDHINKLYQIIKSNGVKYYDVQTELVDHFATALEEENMLSFEDKIQNIIQDFGGRQGLKSMVWEKKKILIKRFLKMYFMSLKEYFSLPKILLTLAIFVGLEYSFRTIAMDSDIYSAIAQLLNVLVIFQGIYGGNSYLKKLHNKGYEFLMIKSQDYIHLMLSIPVFLLFFITIMYKNFTNSIVFSLIITTSMIMLLAYSNIKKYLIKKVLEEYPSIV
ncbi:hypothetical protein [Aquimarina sp. MMG016]|uniref:hypothetical protein n=1 Tax=Aquimarina sp. MMG016 TaxID=2822690 RepID=UPI001B39DCA1|nr:hypothetical protein [Aquimarina sp. MMG016]MBQ4820120.1 hypothetical protein [Aquimarina sp. MMG016]